MGGDPHHLPCVLVYALQGGGRTSQQSQGMGWRENVMYTLNATDEHGIVVVKNENQKAARPE